MFVSRSSKTRNITTVNICLFAKLVALLTAGIRPATVQCAGQDYDLMLRSTVLGTLTRRKRAFRPLQVASSVRQRLLLSHLFVERS